MKFFNTALSLEFERFEDENLAFIEDFNKGANLQNKWKKLAAKIDFSEGEELLFKMLLSLQESVLRLENKNDKTPKLKQKAMICALNFSGFKLQKNAFEKDALYYAKIHIDNELVKLFFRALSENEGEISQIKKDDKTMLDAFVVEIQRQEILKNKGDKNE